MVKEPVSRHCLLCAAIESASKETKLWIMSRPVREYNYSFIKVYHNLLSITIIANFMHSVPFECDECIGTNLEFGLSVLQSASLSIDKWLNFNARKSMAKSSLFRSLTTLRKITREMFWIRPCNRYNAFTIDLVSVEIFSYKSTVVIYPWSVVMMQLILMSINNECQDFNTKCVT